VDGRRGGKEVKAEQGMSNVHFIGSLHPMEKEQDLKAMGSDELIEFLDARYSRNLAAMRLAHEARWLYEMAVRNECNALQMEAAYERGRIAMNALEEGGL
jgi:hypothetical protein